MTCRLGAYAASAILGAVRPDEEMTMEPDMRVCPHCGHDLMPPEPEGTPGDDSYYCEGCGKPWSLDLSRELL